MHVPSQEVQEVLVDSIRAIRPSKEGEKGAALFSNSLVRLGCACMAVLTGTRPSDFKAFNSEREAIEWLKGKKVD
mgnify:CR=1 FL=1